MKLQAIQGWEHLEAHQSLEGTQRTSGELTDAQRCLLQVMRHHKFGRIEHLRVHGGQPVVDRTTKVVRAARLGGGSGEARPVDSAEFELNQSVRDLFAELARLQQGVILTLEFRHGLPWLLETAEAMPSF